MTERGYHTVRPANPYWEKNGATFEDPDGYRVVLENAGLERVTRLELATSSLARRCSTTELHPHLPAASSGEAGAGCNNVQRSTGAQGFMSAGMRDAAQKHAG